MSGEEQYLDYDTFLDRDFSPTAFANTLIHATNNANDTPLDLATPLSRVRFDVQEVDARVAKIADESALPILEYTKDTVGAGEQVLAELETQVAALTGSYERLEREIIQRHAAAEETRLAAVRLWQTVRLGRAVGRCLTLGRQLEAQVAEIKSARDHGVLVRGASTVLALRQVFDQGQRGGDAEGLDSIHVVKTLKDAIVEPGEKAVILRAEQVVSGFSMSTLTAAAEASFAQLEDTRSRASSALVALYLLSPVTANFEPALLIAALQDYLRRAITSSLAGIAAALATLPKLDRTLTEVSARCQNIVALELLLQGTAPPEHALLETQPTGSLLDPLLASLDTSGLPSYFWRSIASQLAARVAKILRDGGVSARTLRSNKERVKEAVRACVMRGSVLPAAAAGAASTGTGPAGTGSETVAVSNWEREAAVMVGALTNALGR